MIEQGQNILVLTLKKKWFDMIASGEKREEYREIKSYWEKRLSDWMSNGYFLKHKDFDIVRFKNGYAKDAPTMDVECLRIIRGVGAPEWGAVELKYYYVIELGKIISINR